MPKIQEHEVSIEDVIYDKESENIDIEKQAFEENLLGWIELIENEKLHKAIKDLSIEDQIFISYIVRECKTQQELASKYGINQSSVRNKFNKILRILKNSIFRK